MIIQTKNLKKHFGGVKAIDGLNLEIQKNKITALIGPNGSGKTTLINVLSGMLPSDSGKIFIDGAMTRTWQNIRLFEQMTVLDNIKIVLSSRNIWKSLKENLNNKKANAILKEIGLHAKRNQLAANLSYGQRKLLEIGRALATSSDIYLFDEPFAGLFPEIRERVKKIIKDLSRTIIIIEHDMNLIKEMADYALVLDAGKLLAEGAPARVLKNKKVIKAYLGE